MDMHQENDFLEKNQDLWGIYASWGLLLVLEMMALGWFTGIRRVKYQTIHGKEDKMWMDQNKPIIMDVSGNGHPEVARIRQAHRSDLQIVLPYLIIVPMWFQTQPCLQIARILLRVFPVARILHTNMHMKIIPGTNFTEMFAEIVSYIIVGYMSVSCIRSNW